tara:strand:- start:461 stop:958 length:498 start_codon:yes stop_codon:yes gene_type:complete
MADAAMTTRRYVFLDGAGKVTGDNETATWPHEWAKFDQLPLPATQVDVTDDPKWKGVGSLVGHARNAATGRFTPPPPPVTVLRIKKTAFIDILTPTEYVALLGPQTDPQLAWGVGLYNAAPDPFLTEDPRVARMLNYSAVTGVLTQARADQIYAEMIAVSEPFSV